MNARTDKSVLSPADPLDVTDVEVKESTALALPNARLVVTEVLDALPKSADGEAIVNIVPIKYELTDATLAAIRAEFEGVSFEVATPDGKKAARAAVSRLTKLATGMDDAYKAWNGPIMAMTKHARDVKEKVQEQLAALKKPISDALDAQRAKEEAAEVERAAAESRRVDAHTAALSALQKLPDTFVSATVAEIDAAIAELSSFEYLTRRDWQEYAMPAQDAQRTGIEKLKAHRINAVAREELVEIQAKQARENAEREAAERAATAERERVDALKERIRNIETSPMAAFGTPSASIQRVIDRLDRVDVTEFGDLSKQAQDALTTARAMLSNMFATAKASEDAAVKAAADAAELQALRDKQAEAEREAAERAAAEAAAEAARKEAEAQAERDAQAARERAEAEEREREQAAMEAFTERIRSQALRIHALLSEARPFVTDADLSARIDAALADTQAE